MDIEPEAVLRTLARPDVARALLHHPRRATMVNTTGNYYHVVNGQYAPLSGLHRRIDAVFCTEEAPTDWRRAPRKKRAPHKRVKRARGAKGTGGGRFAGLIKGSRVHAEMRAFALYDARAFNKTHDGGVHSYVTRLMEAIVKLRRWTPFLPEFEHYDEALGLGTQADLVAVDAAGDLVLLEIKTGYADYWTRADGMMRGCLARLPNSPCNRATLQIAISGLVLQRRYGVPAARMHLYVLRIDDAVIDIVPVPPRFLAELGDAIYADLLRYQQALVAARAAPKKKETLCRTLAPPARRPASSWKRAH